MITVEQLANKYEALIPHRDRRLFTAFLVKGYHQTTLSCVPLNLKAEVVYAKVCLGMYITLLDDLADNPAFLNPGLLRHLYRINIEDTPKKPEMNDDDSKLYDLAIHLLSELERTLQRLPKYQDLKNILSFDLKQFYLANQFSELVTTNSALNNLTETKVHGAYNMGIVAAGTIDLMASDSFEMKDLGLLREALILGQRVGRIGNIIHTFTREQKENDVTNEILAAPEGVTAYSKILLDEIEEGLKKLSEKSTHIKSVSLVSYMSSLRDLYNLHYQMEGII